MRVTTKEIMQKFSISFEKAREILLELYTKEQKISKIVLGKRNKIIDGHKLML